MGNKLAQLVDVYYNEVLSDEEFYKLESDIRDAIIANLKWYMTDNKDSVVDDIKTIQDALNVYGDFYENDDFIEAIESYKFEIYDKLLTKSYILADISDSEFDKIEEVMYSELSNILSELEE